MSKDAAYIKLINTSRWRQLRLQKLQSQPLCERCQENDRITPAREVHHIIPVESVSSEVQMKDLMFTFDNLMSLCHECHVEIHKQLFSHTKANVKAANARKTARLIEKFL